MKIVSYSYFNLANAYFIKLYINFWIKIYEKYLVRAKKHIQLYKCWDNGYKPF